MADREKVIKGVHDAQRYLEDREWVDKSVGVHIDALNDVLALMKEQETDRLEIAHEMVSNSILMYQGKELVRCKDCEYQVDRGRKYKECDKHFLWAKDDWFCADGEVKDDA